MKFTHFGYQEIPENEKVHRVSEVFSGVADKYDLMNDCMSLGLHRWWKRYAVSQSGVCPGNCVLDLACGSGDLTALLLARVGSEGQVVALDINEAMLARGRDRLIDSGKIGNVTYVQADAEHLPFTDNYFDVITMAFGLRNVTDQAAALRSMYRVMKPGGKLVILEFSLPHLSGLNKLYDFYSFHIIPKMGEWICQDRASYQYLVESIRKHPDQETLCKKMRDSGWEDTAFTNLQGGIVAVHTGWKY